MSLNESIVEDAALEWFGELGYAVGHGPQRYLTLVTPRDTPAPAPLSGDLSVSGGGCHHIH